MTQIDKSRFEWIGSDSARREGISRPSTTFWKDAIGRLMKNKVAVVCFFIIVLLILSCIIVPFFSPFESREQHLGEVNKGFMTVCTDSRYEGQHHVHYFGTDNLGRDLFLRAFEGGRVSLMIAFAAVFVNLIVGLIYGGISGYIGGAVDTIMMRIVEIVNGIPYLIVVILLMMVLPKGIFTMSSPTASPAGPAWHVLCVVRCSSSRVRSISWRQKPWAQRAPESLQSTSFRMRFPLSSSTSPSQFRARFSPRHSFPTSVSVFRFRSRLGAFWQRAVKMCS